MIGLDSNGTIPQSDLDFLAELGFGVSDERPLYVIANKAELKPAKDIEDILDNFETCLDDNDIQYAGVAAYSSRNRKVYASRGQDLFDFLASNNAQREHHSYLIDSLCDTFRPYVEAICKDDHEKSQYRKNINNLLMNALKTGSIDAMTDSNPLEEGLLELEQSLTHGEKLEVRLERLETLLKKFTLCVDGFCEEIGMRKTDASYVEFRVKNCLSR
jgi:hypothetical protein